jgi:O-antigen/teichoic acid export membrane protein
MAAPMMLITGFTIINQRADVIMVGAFAGTTSAGIYAAAARLANLLVWGLTAVNMIAAPLFAQLHAEGKLNELQRITTLASLGIALFTLPAAAVMLAAGGWLLELFGKEFIQAYPALVFLVAGQCVNALTGSVGYLLIMTGTQREAAIVVGVTAVMNIILNYILIPWMGLAGAALATASCTVLWNGAMYCIVKNKLAVDPSLFGLLRLSK